MVKITTIRNLTITPESRLEDFRSTGLLNSLDIPSFLDGASSEEDLPEAPLGTLVLNPASLEQTAESDPAACNPRLSKSAAVSAVRVNADRGAPKAGRSATALSHTERSAAGSPPANTQADSHSDGRELIIARVREITGDPAEVNMTSSEATQAQMLSNQSEDDFCPAEKSATDTPLAAHPAATFCEIVKLADSLLAEKPGLDSPRTTKSAVGSLKVPTTAVDEEKANVCAVSPHMATGSGEAVPQAGMPALDLCETGPSRVDESTADKLLVETDASASAQPPVSISPAAGPDIESNETGKIATNAIIAHSCFHRCRSHSLRHSPLHDLVCMQRRNSVSSLPRSYSSPRRFTKKDHTCRQDSPPKWGGGFRLVAMNERSEVQPLRACGALSACSTPCQSPAKGFKRGALSSNSFDRSSHLLQALEISHIP